ncbi:type II toxin-antitoxin system RelE/ParE family toxin [Flammeovirga sp. MY04]|uniref:type II toxin-antitoxin system RelE/ParE family toxin n=1 Tax=Flammeovirga sp. MY04 TaxID=1191459 RepID=UPI00080634AF|nr:type II toxin-antitoxin system RelE/ParE family toxin [Flammeovirga sp. MY04]ANQ51198.1 type II toxin-antitoxin system RelE/ParE family toxin [Flammeovirga sp. MY04]
MQTPTNFSIQKTKEFEKWFSKLEKKSLRAFVAIDLRIRKLERGMFGDVKPIGNGLHELRLSIEKGYRIYFTNDNGKIIILLVGGDKGSQKADIKKAFELKQNL